MNNALTELDDGFVRRLRSPTTGAPLYKIDASILTDGEEFWPCVDGIPFLRVGRKILRDSAISEIRNGNVLGALALLLMDRRDDSIPKADPAKVRRVVESATNICAAMEGLGYGDMAPYIYHRWSLPTYLSGLALLESHAPQGASLFEIGCGSGHFLRAWTDASGQAIGADLVFSYLWLCRRFVAPLAHLVCFDANGPFPLAAGCADICFAQDAFHYFSHKERVLDELRRVSATGIILLGHVHNAARQNYSPGTPLELEFYRKCIGAGAVYDDADLTVAALTGAPATAAVNDHELRQADAFSFACGSRPGLLKPFLTLPAPGKELRLNPRISNCGPKWPDKFESEYAAGWDYLKNMRYRPEQTIATSVAGGVIFNPAIERYARERLFLDLPADW